MILSASSPPPASVSSAGGICRTCSSWSFPSQRSGKTTIVERLLLGCPVKLVKSVSATTRPRAWGKFNGENYYFLSADEFQARRDRHEFLECAEVHSSGNWYGTLKSEVQRARQVGGWALLEIDVQGHSRSSPNIRRRYQFREAVA